MATAAAADPPQQQPSQSLINLTSTSSSRVLFATDEWFAIADNLLNPAEPEFVPDLYCDEGKVMDGWETRRKRGAGHDWCVVKLGGDADADANTAASNINEDATYDVVKVEVDTAYFTGNQAPRISVEGVRVRRDDNTTTITTNIASFDNDDYLIAWMPGASSRLARGGGVRGTGASVAQVKTAAEACRTVAKNNGGEWIEILPMTPLKPGYEETRRHSFAVGKYARQKLAEMGGITHIRVNYFPDGGVARLKLIGRTFINGNNNNTTAKRPIVDADVQRTIDNSPATNVHLHSWSKDPPSSVPYRHPELSCTTHGGLGLECSNKHYGVPMNLIRPSLGKDMGDGWETARHPDRSAVVTKDPATGLQDTPLFDWAVLKLGCGGTTDAGISRIIVDTRHFKGNFPESVKIDGCAAGNTTSDEQVCASAGESESDDSNVEWFPLLPRVAMVAHAEHEFTEDRIANTNRKVTHVRVSIYPDGGLSRVRIYGEPMMVEKPPISHL